MGERHDHMSRRHGLGHSESRVALLTIMRNINPCIGLCTRNVCRSFVVLSTRLDLGAGSQDRDETSENATFWYRPNSESVHHIGWQPEPDCKQTKEVDEYNLFITCPRSKSPLPSARNKKKQPRSASGSDIDARFERHCK